MEEKVVRCDVCYRTGERNDAVDRLSVWSMTDRRRFRVDLCRKHRDELLASLSAVGAKSASTKPPSKLAGRTMPTEYRCDEHDVESSAQGMAAHWRAKHANGTGGAWPDSVRSKYRRAYDRAHAT